MPGQVEGYLLLSSNSAAGKCAALEGFGIFHNFIQGSQHQGKMGSVDEIRARCMPPIHVEPFLPVGIVLVKQVIIALEPA